MNKEEIYTQQTIIPLLRKMGYLEVTYNHGISEFGKDVLFAEYDKFGNKKYYAAQIKAKDISGNNQGDMTDIINHITKAFCICFDDLITKEKKYISEFFIITSGKFTESAHKMINDHIELKKYLHRSHFYEGHHIEELLKKNFQDIKTLCNTLISELKFNINLSKNIEFTLTKNAMFYGNFLDGVSKQLLIELHSFDNEHEFIDKLFNYQFLIVYINKMLDALPIVGTPSYNSYLVNRTKDILTTIDNLETIIKQFLNKHYINL